MACALIGLAQHFGVAQPGAQAAYDQSTDRDQSLFDQNQGVAPWFAKTAGEATTILPVDLVADGAMQGIGRKFGLDQIAEGSPSAIRRLAAKAAPGSASGGLLGALSPDDRRMGAFLGAAIPVAGLMGGLLGHGSVSMARAAGIPEEIANLVEHTAPQAIQRAMQDYHDAMPDCPDDLTSVPADVVKHAAKTPVARVLKKAGLALSSHPDPEDAAAQPAPKTRVCPFRDKGGNSV
ncbi:MAG: hypothetical protein KGO02_22305 [Alphaproteobacteria bacterium]|nr:hypothetical protein [Alphaproteobacteria bacterium]